MAQAQAWADVEPGSSPAQLAIGCSKAENSLCKQIPGCNIGRDGIWRVPLTWPAYACFRTVWASQPVTVYPGLQAWAEAKWAEIQARYANRLALDATDPQITTALAGLETDGGPQLDGPQRGALQWLVHWRRAILGDDRGSGKTPPVIRGMQLLPGDGPMLVICPDSAPLEWRRKMARWAPQLATVIIGGSAKKRADAIGKLADGTARVGIICWQNVRYHTRLAQYPGRAFARCDACGGVEGKKVALCEVHPKDLNTLRLALVVADEGHRMADPGSKQTRAVWWLMHHAENAWVTTGTLTVNDIGDLWPVLHGLDPLGFPSRGRFNDLFAQKDFAFAGKGEVILGLRPDTAATFHVIAEPMFRRTPKAIARAGSPGLAEPEFRYPPMSPKQEAAYRAVTRAGVLELNGQELVPENTVVKFTRQCQLASAMIELSDGEDKFGFTEQVVSVCLPSNKVADLLDFLADNPGQWIVAFNSPPLAALAAAKLAAAKITYTVIQGGMTYGQKDEAAVAFQRGDARVIFVNDAGSEAIDLQAAEGVFWLQPSPSFRYREQMTGRADRRGQTRIVRQVWSLSPGTVDIRMYQMGLDKAEQHQQVVQDVEALRWMMSAEPGEIIGEGNGTDGTGSTQPARA